MLTNSSSLWPAALLGCLVLVMPPVLAEPASQPPSQPAPAQASTPDTPAALPAGLSEDPDDPPETALFGTVDAAAAPVWRVVAWTVGAAGLVLSLYGVSTIAQSLGQDANPLTVHGGLAFSISGVTVVALASALLELLP